MLKDEVIDFTHFPDLIGAVMKLNELEEESGEHLDEDGLLELPLLPLRGMVLYPQMVTPLFVGRDKSMAAVQAAAAHNEPLVVVTQRDAAEDDPDSESIYIVGTEVNVGKLVRLPDASNSVLCQGKRRVEVVEFVQYEPYIRVKVRPIPANEIWDDATEALMRAVLDMFEKVVGLNRRLPEDAFTYALNADQPGQLADFIAGTIEVPVDLKQNLLATTDPNERLREVSLILAREVDVLETENRIHTRIQSEIDKTQREHFLREQLRAIQGELGEADIFTQELNELRSTIESLELPDAVRAKTEKELARMTTMPPMSPEMGVVRTYLDWVADLPWKKQSMGKATGT